MAIWVEDAGRGGAARMRAEIWSAWVRGPLVLSLSACGWWLIWQAGRAMLGALY